MDITLVTCVGADDSVDPADLIASAAKFPEMEIGLQVCGEREAVPGFPSRVWLKTFVNLALDVPIRCVLQVSGDWAIGLAQGEPDRWPFSLLSKYRPTDGRVTREHAVFQRLQLNVDGVQGGDSPFDVTLLAATLEFGHGRRMVLRSDDYNQGLLDELDRRGAEYDIVERWRGARAAYRRSPNHFTSYAGVFLPDGGKPAIGAVENGDCFPIGIEIKDQLRSEDGKSYRLEGAAEIALAVRRWNSVEPPKRMDNPL
jgi:hypothetical protein